MSFLDCDDHPVVVDDLPVVLEDLLQVGGGVDTVVHRRLHLCILHCTRIMIFEAKKFHILYIQYLAKGKV